MAVPVGAETGALPQRADIEDQYKWSVEDMYATLDAWEADFARLEAGLAGFEQYKGHLADSPQQLLNCLLLSDSLGSIDGDLYIYAYLKLDEDNRESKYQDLGGRISGLDARLDQATAFIEPEILEMDKATLDGMLAQEPALEVYRYYLEELMRQKAHILSAEEERIMALASPVTGAPGRIFNMIDNADHRMGAVVNNDGDTIQLNQGRYVKILKGTDREARRIANDTVQASWQKYANTLAATFDASLKADWFQAQARGYNSCLEASLDNYDIPVSVFHNLIEAVNENLEPLHKLTRLRKQVLGYDTLYTYDLSISLVPEFEKEYTYEDAKKLMLEGLKPLGDDYLKDVKMGLKSHWIDVFESEGKGSGAYNWGTYNSHPYILLNFDGTLGYVFTLAHEMGHAMHAFNTNANEPYAYHGHSLFTAEVASTCNEAVMMKYMLSKAKTREEKIVLLDYYINQIEGTFFTQVMFSEFELAVHDHIENGGAISLDYLRQTYRDIFQKYQGPDLVIGPNNDLGCIKIGHFYRQYYVYQYATSYCAAQALSQKILEKEDGALEAYLDFLKVGKSKNPIDILKDAGVDMNSPDPVQRTIKLFGELVDEMERLLLQES